MHHTADQPADPATSSDDRSIDLTALDAQLAALRERRPGFPDRDRPFATLAMAIVWSAKVPAETVVLEASAGSRRPMADLAQEEEQLRASALDEAEAQALNLENGLRLAHNRGTSELPLDSRDPAEDRLAGALISMLVASDFATARTEDLGDEQYRYHIGVNWPKLGVLVDRLGLPPLPHLLADDRPA